MILGDHLIKLERSGRLARPLRKDDAHSREVYQEALTPKSALNPRP